MTAKNHTATHLLHAALRQTLGDHVKQAGSLVAPDRLRFDFTHFSPLTPQEVDRIEEAVNAQVWENRGVVTQVMALDDALASGAMALFGERYGEQVRVVSVPEFSTELCGGRTSPPPGRSVCSRSCRKAAWRPACAGSRP